MVVAQARAKADWQAKLYLAAVVAVLGMNLLPSLMVVVVAAAALHDLLLVLVARCVLVTELMTELYPQPVESKS